MSDQLETEVQRWLSFAEADLVEVRLNLAHGGRAHIACFHAQQAAEKALKALLLGCGCNVPRTHDLDQIRDELPTGPAAKERFPRLGALTVWAIASRYPGEWPEATREDAESARDLAQRVFSAVLRDLAAKGYGSLPEISSSENGAS